MGTDYDFSKLRIQKTILKTSRKSTLKLQSCPTLCDPVDCSLSGSLVHGDSPGMNTGVGCHAFPGNLPNSGLEPWYPTLLADSLPSEPPGKPKNTGVGSLNPSPAYLPNPGIKLGCPAL